MDGTTFAFIDLETTGGSPTGDRIIEIGLRLWRDGCCLEDWQTLINPDTRISPFIEHYTGITNAMVADAPRFAEVADTLREKLRDAVFVAHNARFDYGFVKAEFKRLEQAFSARVLCTVKLSRALYPEHRRHGMDALIERFGLNPGPRHRAMGDVASMFAFFQHALEDKGRDQVKARVQHLLKRPSLPSHVPDDLMQSLPNGPGVYRFYGEEDVLLYVGKSTHIAQRVGSHFSGDHASTRGVRLSQSLRRVEWTETAGELGALLLELRQIKTLKPLYNRRSRAAKQLLTLAVHTDPQGYLAVRIERLIDPRQLDRYYGLFRTKKDAERALSGLLQKNTLCNRLLGLEPLAQGPCFQARLGRCLGACEGREDVTRYNLRTQIALHGLRLKTWPWPGPVAVFETDPFSGRTDGLILYNWAHVATVHGEEELATLDLSTQVAAFDLDSYRLMLKVLLKPPAGVRIVPLPGAVGLPTLCVDTD